MSLPVSVRRAARALVVAILLLGSAGAQAASAVTVRVDDDRAECPHAKFRRISSALAAVPADSTIVVCPGTYAETLRIDKPGVRVMGLRGRHADIVLMHPRGVDPLVPMVEMSAPDTTLAAVKIRDSRPVPGAAVDCFVVGVLVDNGPGSFAGASVVDNVTVRELALGTPPSEFECSEVERSGIFVGAFVAQRPGRAIVRNSTVRTVGTGVAVAGEGSNATVSDNVITAAAPGALAPGAGISIGGGTARIVRNDVSHHGLGVEGQFAGHAVVSGNNIHDIDVVGIELLIGMTATVVNNDIHGDIDGMFVTTQGSVVAGNRIDGGITLGDGEPVASGNEFVDNVATRCVDPTHGDGTAGTANTWIGNIGSPSIPAEICRPPGP